MSYIDIMFCDIYMIIDEILNSRGDLRGRDG